MTWIGNAIGGIAQASVALRAVIAQKCNGSHSFRIVDTVSATSFDILRWPTSQLPNHVFMNANNPDIYPQLLRYLPSESRANWSQSLINDTHFQYAVLAARFAHDVKLGGFALLLHNMNGQMLAEMEDMLLQAKAPFAHDYYIQAIRACLFHQADYEILLSHDNLIPFHTELLIQLSELSQNYLGAKLPFEFEAEAFLIKILQISGAEVLNPDKINKLFATTNKA